MGSWLGDATSATSSLCDWCGGGWSGGVSGFRSASHMSREIAPRVAVVNALNAAAGVWPVKSCPGEAYRGMRFGQGQHPAPDTRLTKASLRA